MLQSFGGSSRRQHDGGINQDEERQQVEQREGADDRAIWLEKLPYEALQRIVEQRKVETICDDEMISVQDRADIEGREDGHRKTLVELHRMARHAVAEIMAPGQRGWRAIGEVVEASEVAADPADRDADRKRQGKAGAGAQRNAVQPFVELDGDNATGQRPFDRPRDSGLA